MLWKVVKGLVNWVNAKELLIEGAESLRVHHSNSSSYGGCSPKEHHEAIQMVSSMSFLVTTGVN
jgi:hypothetical protein